MLDYSAQTKIPSSLVSPMIGLVMIIIVFLCSTTYAYAADKGDLNLRRLGASLINKSSNLKGTLDIVKGKIGITFTKPIVVSYSCGEAWLFGRRVALHIKEDGILLQPLGGRAEINFDPEQKITRCIGQGTKLAFSRSRWIPFFGNEYKSGGFTLQNDGFRFWKGTQGRLYGGKHHVFDGTDWRLSSANDAVSGSLLTSDLIMRLQKRLNEIGYAAGAVDGLWGKKTSRAVRSYQINEKLPITGELDHKTLVKLGIIKE
jgi:hypothetical protein